MSLRSANIAPVRRLSLKRSQPAREVVVATTPESVLQDVYTRAEVEEPKPLTGKEQEEKAYNTLLGINPILGELVGALDLVSRKTGERIGKEPAPVREKVKRPATDPKLKALAKKLIEGEKSYTREELISRIAQGTNTPQERAEKGFNLMVEAGLIKQIKPVGLFYLRGSTPF